MIRIKECIHLKDLIVSPSYKVGSYTFSEEKLCIACPRIYDESLAESNNEARRIKMKNRRIMKRYRSIKKAAEDFGTLMREAEQYLKESVQEPEKLIMDCDEHIEGV